MSVWVLWRWGEMICGDDDHILVFSTEEKAVDYCNRKGWTFGTINNYCSLGQLFVI